MKALHTQIFTERFRPKTMDDILLPQRIRDEFEDINNINQNFIFEGQAGVGKCVTQDTRITIKRSENSAEENIDFWWLIKYALTSRMPQREYRGDSKFAWSIRIPEGLLVKSDNGFVKCNAVHETVIYKVLTLKTEKKTLQCADDHIVFKENGETILVKQLEKGMKIMVDDGVEEVEEVVVEDYYEKMYDLEIATAEHKYLTNGIVSHNTTLAKIIANDKPYLYINVSDESSVDVIRTKITNFCSSLSVMDNHEAVKVVLLDEMDGASEQFYKALRGTVEKFAHNTRFIGTCNYISKIPEPIQSRFSVISFNSISKEEEKEVKIMALKRVHKIAKELGINFDKDAIVEFIKRNYPDLRTMMNKLQSFHDRGIKKITKEDIVSLNYVFNDLFKMIVKHSNPEEFYVYLMSNYVNKTDDVLNGLSKDFPNWILENKKELIGKIPEILIATAEYQNMKQNIDPTTPMLACVYKITQIITE